MENLQSYDTGKKENSVSNAIISFEQNPAAILDIVGKRFDVDKNGKPTMDGFKALSRAMEIYSDKHYETARYLFIKDGQIIRHKTVTSQTPSSTRIKPDNRFLYDLKNYADDTNSKIVFLHNHPSGYVEPSEADIDLTSYLLNFFAKSDGSNSFCGHIILDHGSYGLWTSETNQWNALIDGKLKPIDAIEKKVRLTKYGRQVAFATDGIPMKSMLELAEFAKQCDSVNAWNKKDWIPAFLLTGNGVVSSFEHLSTLEFENEYALSEKLKYLGRNYGSENIVLFPDSKKQFLVCERFAQDTGKVKDIFYKNPDGTFELSQFRNGNIFSDLEAGEIIVDDSENYERKIEEESIYSDRVNQNIETNKENKTMADMAEKRDFNANESISENIEQKKDSFDLELEKFNDGKLPDSHVFNLGKPGEILQNCGFPAEHRIELAAARLRMKATQGNHPFDIMDIQGLVGALQEPVVVFEYGDKSKSQNVIVNLEKDGKNFLVGVFFNQKQRGYEVSDIRGLFNRDNMDWIHWIQQGKMIYGNKEKIQVLAEQQRTNLAEVHNKEARTSSDSYYLDSVDNILQSFGDVKDIYTKDYPGYAEQKERFEIFKKFRSAYQKVEAINVLDAVQEADEFYDALKSNNKEVIARYTDAFEYPELADAAKSIIEERSFSQKAEKYIADVNTYRFQSGESLEELIRSDNDFPTDAAFLDNLIDVNIREVYGYATEEEQKVLRQFASSRNDYDTDMKTLAVQTDCISRWIAARHWNPEQQEFQKEYVNHKAIKDFPYELPWEMKMVEAAVFQSESKEKATEFVLSKLKSAGIEVISDKTEFESTLAELKDSDELIQRMTESFEKSEKLQSDNNSVLRANEEVRDILSEALDKTAEPLKDVVYSWENYVRIFGDGVIQSPVETIKMGRNQFVRLCPPDRNNLMGAIYETMTKPSIVLEKETFDEKSESFKPVHVYGKSFINQDNDHKRAVESIIVFKDGQNIAASLHNKTISALVKQIKTADDIIYLDKEASRVAMFDLKDGYSHVVKETEEFLSSAGQKSLPLWNKSYDEGKILSISDLIAKGEIEGGKLEITKDNFDKYFNIFNQNIRVYKDKPNKIASDLFSFYVKPENKTQMKRWLESQGYKINENQRAEKAVLSEYTVSDGTTYGFAYNGKIYLNPDFADSDVAIHEYTHLWDEYTKNTNPQLWEKGKDVFRKTHIWQEVKSDSNYADIADNDDLVLSEVHSRICGKMTQEVLERIAREDGEIAKDRAIDWNKEFNEYLFSEHGLFAKEKLGNERLFIEEFMSLPVKDLFNENREINMNSPSRDESVDNGIEAVLANGGMSEAAMERDYEAEQNQKSGYIDEDGKSHWLDEENGIDTLGEERNEEYFELYDNASALKEEKSADNAVSDKLNYSEKQQFKDAIQKLTEQNQELIKQNIQQQKEIELLKNREIAPKDEKKAGEISQSESRDSVNENNHRAENISTRGFSRENAYKVNTVLPKFGHPNEKTGKTDIIENAVFAKLIENRLNNSMNQVVLSIPQKDGSNKDLIIYEQEYNKLINACERFEEMKRTVEDNTWDWVKGHQDYNKAMLLDEGNYRMTTAENFMHNFRVHCIRQVSNPEEALYIAKEMFKSLNKRDQERFAKMKKSYEKLYGKNSYTRLLLKEFEAISKEKQLSPEVLKFHFNGDNVIIQDMNKDFNEMKIGEEIEDTGVKVGDTIPLGMTMKTFDNKKIVIPKSDFKIVRVSQNMIPNRAIIINEKTNVVYKMPLKELVTHIRKVEKHRRREEEKDLKKQVKTYGFKGQYEGFSR